MFDPSQFVKVSLNPKAEKVAKEPKAPAYNFKATHDGKSFRFTPGTGITVEHNLDTMGYNLNQNQEDGSVAFNIVPELDAEALGRKVVDGVASKKKMRTFRSTKLANYLLEVGLVNDLQGEYFLQLDDVEGYPDWKTISNDETKKNIIEGVEDGMPQPVNETIAVFDTQGGRDDEPQLSMTAEEIADAEIANAEADYAMQQEDQDAQG